MFQTDADAFFHCRLRPMFAGLQKMFDLLEDPWIGNGPAADHHSVAAGCEHGLGVFGSCHVAVSEHGNFNGLFDFGKPSQAGKTVVGLRRRAEVEGQACAPACSIILATSRMTMLS